MGDIRGNMRIEDLEVDAEHIGEDFNDFMEISKKMECSLSSNRRDALIINIGTPMETH